MVNFRLDCRVHSRKWMCPRQERHFHKWLEVCDRPNRRLQQEIWRANDRSRQSTILPRRGRMVRAKPRLKISRKIQGVFIHCSWRGTYFWGVSCEGAVRNSLGELPSSTNVTLLSGSETETLKEKLAETFELVEAAGAGYKQLCVAQGFADVYVLSRGSTYR